MKHILSIQDLSCVGRCSLTVALPVLSAMGIRCSVLPTAVLSTHTAFSNPQVVPMTDHLQAFCGHWLEHQISFDGVSVGYLSDPEQAEIVGSILARLKTTVVLDPVMGDQGNLYRRIGPAHIEAVKNLTARADVLLPNLTEAAALTGIPYREDPEKPYLERLTDGLLEVGAKTVVITGVRWPDGSIGCFGKEWGKPAFCCRNDYVPRHFHGTGDLFAAVFTGSLMEGDSPEVSCKKAARFVYSCICATPETGPHGVEFESRLSDLWNHSPECEKNH